MIKKQTIRTRRMAAAGNREATDPDTNTSDKTKQSIDDFSSNQIRDWSKINQAITEYVDEYEMFGEDETGRAGSYSPTEGEQALITDAIHGLLGNDKFVAAFTNASGASTSKEQLSGTLATHGLVDDIEAQQERDAVISANLNAPPTGKKEIVRWTIHDAAYLLSQASHIPYDQAVSGLTSIMALPQRIKEQEPVGFSSGEFGTSAHGRRMWFKVWASGAIPEAGSRLYSAPTHAR